jgi:hypothetical protein
MLNCLQDPNNLADICFILGKYSDIQKRCIFRDIYKVYNSFKATVSKLDSVRTIYLDFSLRAVQTRGDGNVKLVMETSHKHAYRGYICSVSWQLHMWWL